MLLHFLTFKILLTIKYFMVFIFMIHFYWHPIQFTSLTERNGAQKFLAFITELLMRSWGGYTYPGAYLGRGQRGQLSPPPQGRRKREKRRSEGEEMAVFFEFGPPKTIFFEFVPTKKKS